MAPQISWGEPWPLDKLVPWDKVNKQLHQPGAPWETEQRVIGNRLKTVYKNLPPNMRLIWGLTSIVYAHRPYITYLNETLTYGQVHTQVLSLAYYLRRECFVRAGDKVAIISRNVPEFIAAHWAIHLLGAVCVPINAQGKSDLLKFCVQDVDARAVICDAERYALLAQDDGLNSILGTRGARLQAGVQGAGGRASLERIIVIPRGNPRSVSATNDKIPANQRAWTSEDSCADYDETIAACEQLARAEWEQHNGENIPQAQADDLCTMLFTSGTTGKPKAVMSTQRQYLACLACGAAGSSRSMLRRGWPLPDPTDNKDEDQASLLICVPLFHTSGLQSGVLLATAGGAHLLLLPRWDVNLAVEMVNRMKATYLIGVAFMLRELSMSGKSMPSLRSLGHGGASPSTSLPADVKKSMPGAGAGLGQGYGATETQGTAVSNSADDYYARPASCGLPLPGIECIVIDPDTLTELARGQTGEIWLRGPTVAEGYWNRPKANAETFTPDGWYRTGDLGHIDQEGFVYMSDRVKDMIIRGGENVSANAVEDAVYAAALGIKECAAVAAPDKRYGETVALVCVPVDPKNAPSVESVKEKLRARLPVYAVPEHVWIRSEPLERNPTGKILKVELRKQVKETVEKSWKQSKL